MEYNYGARTKGILRIHTFYATGSMIQLFLYEMSQRKHYHA